MSICTNTCTDERTIALQNLDIAKLLHEAQEGNANAFAELQSLFEIPIRRFVGRMMQRSDDVDDIVQNTFIALYKNLERIDPPEKLRPFLFRVARNLCYDYLRKYYRRDELAIQDCEHRLGTDSTSPEDNAHWTLMLEQVRKAIDCLPEIHRDTLILYVEEGLSQAEIADVMRTEIGTVKSRLHYARKLLKQSVSPDILNVLKQSK